MARQAGRAEGAGARSGSDPAPVLRLDAAAPRRLRVDARLRHPRAASGGGTRAVADERRDDLPALAGQHRPAPGGGGAAARPVRRAVLDRVRVRARAAGDRDVRRRGRRPDLPRARGDVVRDTATAAAPGRVAGRGGLRTRTRRHMFALACPASLKGVLAASQAATALAEGLRAGGASVRELPVADGGEGTAETLRAALGGAWHEADVHDAFGRPRRARWLLLPDGTGGRRIGRRSPQLDPERLDPLAASSRGLRRARRRRARGRAVRAPPSAWAGRRRWTEALASSRRSTSSPSRPASPATSARRSRKRRGSSARRRARRRRRWPSSAAACGSLSISGPGGGAAGGLGAALASLGAELAPASALVLDAIGFALGRVRPRRDGRGSGRRDDGLGKAPGEVAQRCLAADVRCVMFGGIVDEPLAGVETIALSGDPARATEDLRRLGRALARGSGG